MGTTRKPVVLTMSALGAIALLSVGFASWEIRNTSASTSAEGGSISADTVVDKRLKIVGEGSWKPDTICFSGSTTSTPNPNNKWLTVSNDAPEEQLSAVYTFKVACPTDKVTASNNTCPLTIQCGEITVTSNDSLSAWKTATATDGNNYINGTPTIEGKFQDATTTETTYPEMTIYTANVTVTFKWGTKFSSENPYVYYNKQTYTESLAEEALTALKAIKAAAGSVTSFSFTITVSLS